MVRIFLFDVIKVYLKVKVVFVGFGVFFIAQNYNCEPCFRPLPFAILGTVCLKETKPQEYILKDQEDHYRKRK